MSYVSDALIDALEQKNNHLEKENMKLRKLVKYLMFVKPYYVKMIHCEGKLICFDDLLAEVGMRWEDLLAE